MCTCIMCDEHVDDVYHYIHTHLYICIHRYHDFLVRMITVGLVSARPNFFFPAECVIFSQCVW